MTTYLHDGTAYDLRRTWVDVIGIHWRWTSEWSQAGEPLMQALDARNEAPVPLPDVYHDHGPLIPLPDPLTHRAALTNWLRAPVPAPQGGAA